MGIDILDGNGVLQTIATTEVAGVDYPISYCVGDVAQGSADSGNPVKIGGYASSTPLSATSAGYRQNVWLDLNGRQSVGGQVAHGAAIAGNPVHAGAEALSADRTAVTTGNATRLLADLLGKLVALPYAIPQQSVSGVTAAITNTADTEIIAAQAAGVRTYLTSLTITNSHASVGTLVEIKDGSTVKLRVYVAAGASISIPLPMPLRGTAATAWNAANTTNGSNTYVTAVGFTAAN